MTTTQAARSIVISWDWPLALIIVVIICFLFPLDFPYSMAKDIYNVSISILSIIFSVFFAALAILITAGDNEFVNFLEENNGSYSRIIWTYKFTLMLLATSLIFSIILYVTSLSGSELKLQTYPRYILMIFGFINLYSLLAAFHSSLDIINYAQYRSRFIKIINKDKKE